MKQAVLIGQRRSLIKDIDMPSVGPNDVLVKVRASGICASELHTWKDGDQFPCCMGHEVAGEVVACGSDVRGIGLGDRVSGLFEAGFAEYTSTSADRIAPIPDALSFESAFGEPVACAVSAARRTIVELGDRVAIVGLGFMGLLMLQLLRLKGAAQIVGIDLRKEAQQSGLRLGCDTTSFPDALEAPDKQNFDVVIEASGTQDGLVLATKLVREHGMLSILGYHQGGPRQVDMQSWNYKALDVLNAHDRRIDYKMDCMRRGLSLAANGRIDLASLVTHTFGLDQIDAAFAALAEKPSGFIKSVILDGPQPHRYCPHIPSF